jgi:hypothetical protein
MDSRHPIMMAGLAQKMLRILALNCPPNYHCGGPAYAATSAVDNILHLMGIGVALLQREERNDDMKEFQGRVIKDAVCGSTIINQFVQHKSQILSAAIHSVVSDLRRNKLRECEEVTEEALLSVLEWYFKKTGSSIDLFVEKLKNGGHDELIQLESEEPPQKDEAVPA